MPHYDEEPENVDIVTLCFKLMRDQLAMQNKIIIKFIEIMAPTAVANIEDAPAGLGGLSDVLKMVGLGSEIANQVSKPRHKNVEPLNQGIEPLNQGIEN